MPDPQPAASPAPVLIKAEGLSKFYGEFMAIQDVTFAVPEGSVTEAGLRQNVAVGLGYVEAWLRGIGCVPLFNLMEDAATAEISRAQLWQWVHHRAKITDGPNSGTPITTALVEQTIANELATTRAKVDEARFSAYQRAAELMRALIASPTFPDFLTVPAYAEVLAHETY